LGGGVHTSPSDAVAPAVSVSACCLSKNSSISCTTFSVDEIRASLAIWHVFSAASVDSAPPKSNVSVVGSSNFNLFTDTVVRSHF